MGFAVNIYRKLRKKRFIGCYIVDRCYENAKKLKQDYANWGGQKPANNRYVRCYDLSEQLFVQDDKSIDWGGKSDIWLHYPKDGANPGTDGYGRMFVGHGTYIGPGAHIDIYSELHIGDNCLFGPDVWIRDANHGTDLEAALNYVNTPLDIAPIFIDEGCWIGASVQINPGVHIGKRCIIGTAAVVTRDIPDYSMAAGVPARVIKKWDFQKHCWEKV